MSKTKKIAILCRYAKDGLDGNYIGGAEKQMILLAKGLQKQRYDVTIIDLFAKKGTYIYKGIHIVCPWNPDYGISGFRYFYYQMPLLWRAMKIINADYYYVRGESLMHAVVARFAKIQNAKFLWGLAGDWEADFSLREHRVNNFNITGKIAREYLINYSNRVQRKLCYAAICQNNFQLNALGNTVKKKIIIRNIFEENKINKDIDYDREHDFLWIGQISGLKGEENMIDIIHAFPNHTFNFIGRVYQDIHKRPVVLSTLSSFENLNFLGQKQNSEVLDYLKCSKFYIHTSKVEGVSNAILEAMGSGAIVVSLYFNADNMFTEAKVGFNTNGSIEKAIEIIKKLIRDKEERFKIAHKAQSYLRKNYSEEMVITSFSSLLK